MSEGTGVPAEWTRQPGQQPGQPGQGSQPGASGQVSQQGQQSTGPVQPGPTAPRPPQAGGSVPPPPGGFGPPATPYAQPGVPPYGPSGPAAYPPPQPQPQPQPQPLPQQPQNAVGPAPYQQWPQSAQPAVAEPDWNAMATRHENESRKRKRLWIGAAAVAAVLVGGVVAAGVWINGHGDKGDRGGGGPTASASPTGIPTERALAVISDADTDRLPVDAATLFPDQTRTVDGKVWTRMVTGATAPCSKATTGGLGLALGDDTCRSLVRATYVNGDSAVTVGVAVFDNKAGADRAFGRHAGLIQGLSGTGVNTFCVTDKSGCTETHAAIGRFGYFTVAGSLKQVPDQSDQVATAAATSLADRTKQVLLGRAEHAG